MAPGRDGSSGLSLEGDVFLRVVGRATTSGPVLSQGKTMADGRTQVSGPSPGHSWSGPVWGGSETSTGSGGASRRAGPQTKITVCHLVPSPPNFTSSFSLYIIAHELGTNVSRNKHFYLFYFGRN